MRGEGILSTGSSEETSSLKSGYTYSGKYTFSIILKNHFIQLRYSGKLFWAFFCIISMYTFACCCSFYSIYCQFNEKSCIAPAKKFLVSMAKFLIWKSSFSFTTVPTAAILPSLRCSGKLLKLKLLNYFIWKSNISGRARVVGTLHIGIRSNEKFWYWLNQRDGELKKAISIEDMQIPSYSS